MCCIKDRDWGDFTRQMNRDKFCEAFVKYFIQFSLQDRKYIGMKIIRAILDQPTCFDVPFDVNDIEDISNLVNKHRRRFGLDLDTES